MFRIEMKRTIIRIHFFPLAIAYINHTFNVCKKTYNYGKFDSPLGAAVQSFFVRPKSEFELLIRDSIDFLSRGR